MNSICISEYGVLFIKSAKITESLEKRKISKTAWDWLLKEATGTKEHKPLVRPIKRDGYAGLQVLNYVGVITTPCDWQIEIVPKIDKYSSGGSNQEREAEQSRAKLMKMLSSVGIIKPREFNNASLKLFNKPFPDMLIKLFLDDVNQLIKRGIRNDYVPIQEETTYLKGRLNIAAQIRQPVDRRYLFQIEHDEFLPNRAENRLIHSTLLKVSKITQDISNKRLASELLFVFNDIPKSTNYKIDFSRWINNDRSIVHYRPVKPWCDLILNDKTPFSLAGEHHGLSFLFPMHDLFEKYVAIILRKQLNDQYLLEEQVASEYIVEKHVVKKNVVEQFFNLKPDLLIKSIEGNINKVVLDCKWKLITTDKESYGIKSADIYQLYVYGQKYLSGKGDVFLIYPENAKFEKPLPVFKFDDNLRLWVIPFSWENDEEGDRLIFPKDIKGEFLHQIDKP